jgi:hypothetical protein
VGALRPVERRNWNKTRQEMALVGDVQIIQWWGGGLGGKEGKLTRQTRCQIRLTQGQCGVLGGGGCV